MLTFISIDVSYLPILCNYEFTCLIWECVPCFWAASCILFFILLIYGIRITFKLKHSGESGVVVEEGKKGELGVGGRGNKGVRLFHLWSHCKRPGPSEER